MEIERVALSGDWILHQLRQGHAYSTDDLLVVDQAIECVDRPPRRVLDLGCGLGSVMLMSAWVWREAEVVGVEAQALSVDLARRSIEANGCGDRARVLLGDLRDPSLVPGPGTWDLVTGSPPYLPLGHGTVSQRLQRAYCRFEIRGGVEDYCRAAVRALAPDGGFALVHGGRQVARVEAAAREAGLRIARWRRVHGLEGRPPLMALYWMKAGAGKWAMPEAEEALVVRNRDGTRTEAMKRVRDRLGMPRSTRPASSSSRA